MRKSNRIIPFGYRCKNGQLEPEPTEAAIVKDIFVQYIAGASYLLLARALSGGVPYNNDAPDWNKNMVKRILENRRYLGADGLPPLVDSQTFERAAAVQQGKNTGRATAPASSEALRGKLTCAECGGTLRRDTRMDFTRWRCDHSHLSDVPNPPPVVMPENELLVGIQYIFNHLIADPHLVAIPPVEIGAGGAGTLRTRNELQRELEKRDCNEAEAVRLIFSIAVGQYAASDDGGSAREAARLQKRFDAAKPQICFDIALFQDTVQAVAVHEDGHFSIALTTGQHVCPVE